MTDWDAKMREAHEREELAERLLKREHRRRRDKYGDMPKEPKGQRTLNRYRVRDLKAKATCPDCNSRYPHYVMQFDHLPGEPKLGDVSGMIQRGVVWGLIEAEMAKCEIVCANCHMVRTFTRRHSTQSDGQT